MRNILLLILLSASVDSSSAQGPSFSKDARERHVSHCQSAILANFDKPLISYSNRYHMSYRKSTGPEEATLVGADQMVRLQFGVPQPNDVTITDRPAIDVQKYSDEPFRRVVSLFRFCD
jgi:hypothetical protein